MYTDASNTINMESQLILLEENLQKISDETKHESVAVWDANIHMCVCGAYVQSMRMQMCMWPQSKQGYINGIQCKNNEVRNLREEHCRWCKRSRDNRMACLMHRAVIANEGDELCLRLLFQEEMSVKRRRLAWQSREGDVANPIWTLANECSMCMFCTNFDNMSKNISDSCVNSGDCIL